MVDISINDDHLHLEVKGLDKLWAFKSQLDIPLRHIRGVRHDPEAASAWWRVIKLTGTNIPGMFTAGTFYQHGQRVFWDVRDPARSIIIELHDERFGELVIEVNDPMFAVEQIKGKASGLAAHRFYDGPRFKH
jgi:hypothetical protein